MFVIVNVRMRKKRIGSIGVSVRSSQSTNATTRAAPAVSEPTISGPAQPWPLPRTRPQTIPSKPVLARPRPGRSSRPEGPCVSSSRRSASGISTTPSGTLIQKIHCHERPETTAPPTSGPSATARPPIPPQAPSATPRFSAGTADERMVRVSGVMIAPPTPWRARAATSASIEGASAAAAEASVKITSPIENIRLRPNRSPSAAPVRSSTAKVRVYALTVHSRLSMPAPRSFRITGRAVVTTRLSRVTTTRASEVTANVHSVRLLGVPPFIVLLLWVVIAYSLSR